MREQLRATLKDGRVIEILEGDPYPLPVTSEDVVKMEHRVGDSWEMAWEKEAQ